MALSVAATMVLTAAVAVAAAWAVLVVAAVSEVVVVAFVEVVAGANGTEGRFRSGGDFPDAPAADSYGEVSGTTLDTRVRGLR